MLKFVLTCVIAIAFVAPQLPAHSAPPTAKDIVVRVQKNDAAFEVEVEFTVAASAEESWDVLTDYDHMAQIVSSIDSSRIVSRDGNRIEVAQKSHASVGLLRVSTDSLRQVNLIPNREIHSRLVKGDLKASEFTTRVIDEGATTRVTAQGKFIPSALAASAITVEAVEAQTRRQYQELRAEILRRKAKEPPPPCLLAKNCQQSSG